MKREKKDKEKKEAVNADVLETTAETTQGRSPFTECEEHEKSGMQDMSDNTESPVGSEVQDESAEEVDEEVAEETTGDIAESEAVSVEEENENKDILSIWRNREEEVDALEQLRDYADNDDDISRRVRDSLTRIDGFRNGSNEADSRISMAVGHILDIAANVANGIIDPEAIAMVLRANDFDAAMERARNEGEVCGRNALIQEKFFNSKSNAESIPALGGTSASADTRRPGSIFDLASFAR